MDQPIFIIVNGVITSLPKFFLDICPLIRDLFELNSGEIPNLYIDDRYLLAFNLMYLMSNKQRCGGNAIALIDFGILSDYLQIDPFMYKIVKIILDGEIPVDVLIQEYSRYNFIPFMKYATLIFISQDELAMNCVNTTSISDDISDLFQGLIDYKDLLKRHAKMGDYQKVMFLLHITNNYQIAVEGASDGCYWEFFKEIIESSKDYKWNYQRLAELAILNRETFDYVLSKAPINYKYNWQSIIEKSIIQIEMFDYLRMIIPNNYNWNDLLKLSIYCETSFNYIWTLIPKDYNIKWNDLAIICIRKGLDNILKEVLMMIHPNIRQLAKDTSKTEKEICELIVNICSEYNWNLLLESIIINESIEIFDILRNLVPKDYIIDWNLLINAAIVNNKPVTKSMLEERYESKY
jgi:hypothetical protein